MYLALDIGNTRTKAGLFDQNLLSEQANWQGRSLEQLSVWLQQQKPSRAIVSSVADPDQALLQFLRAKMQVLELDADTPLPFENTYRTPHTLGKDRVAAVAGAQQLLQGQACLVIDCGTCIKYELLTADGIYLGGNIAPGAFMRIQAMHTFTARLPEVPMEMPTYAWGNSTETALQNGALQGAVQEILGFWRLFAAQHSGLQVVLTGGDALFFLPHLQVCHPQYEPNLTLIGLHAILQYNINHF
ncbi:MAG: type III pantothenate kinase [Lewinellaceae bacterium]|nr:type III pantothenate kinase [Lewinellaceae bacterium]